MTPSVRQLKYICAVAEHRHFSKAADACFVTQSTLSAAVRELESRLGVMIFERDRKSVRVTPLGERLVRQARVVLGEVEDFVGLAGACGEVLAGELRLGVIPTVGPFLLPRLLSALRESYPKLRLYLREDVSERLVRQLRQGQLDLLILAFPYPLPGMETAPLFRDEFLLCLPPGHALERAERVRQRQLRGERLLLLEEGHCLREHALEACKLDGGDANLAYQGTSLHTLVQMVAGGLGVTLLPALSVQADVLGGTRLALKPIAGGDASREVGMAWRRSDPRRTDYLSLAAFIRDHEPGR